jgi:hypothetical protein
VFKVDRERSTRLDELRCCRFGSRYHSDPKGTTF